MSSEELASVLVPEFDRIANELESVVGGRYAVRVLRPSEGRFGMSDAVGVSIADDRASRRVTFWPHDAFETWIEFEDDGRVTVSDNHTEFAQSNDPEYLRAETEVVFRLMSGQYVVRRVGLLRRKTIIVPTRGATWRLKCGW